MKSKAQIMKEAGSDQIEHIDFAVFNSLSDVRANLWSVLENVADDVICCFGNIRYQLRIAYLIYTQVYDIYIVDRDDFNKKKNDNDVAISEEILGELLIAHLRFDDIGRNFEDSGVEHLIPQIDEFEKIQNVVKEGQMRIQR